MAGRATANPNPGNNCITIFDCGVDACGDGNDTAIGTGSVDAGGNFLVTVSPLIAGHRIFPRDTCNNISGAQVTVQTAPQVPDLNPWGAVTLGVCLAFLIVIRQRARAPRA